VKKDTKSALIGAVRVARIGPNYQLNDHIILQAYYYQIGKIDELGFFKELWGCRGTPKA
jgi:hypothetical protein